MTENQVAIRTIPTHADFEIIKQIAGYANKSGLYKNAGDEAKILTILMAAQEMGVKPFVALNGGLWNIMGKIEISARLMSSMIRNHKHQLKVIQSDEKICILEGIRGDTGETQKAQFTINEAQVAGLTSKDVWKKFPADMLYARALSRLSRRLFSDVIGMSYVEGEIRDAIKPENMAPTPYEEVEIDHEKSLNEYVSAYAEDETEKDNCRKYIVAFCNHYGKTYTQAISEFAIDPLKFDLNLSKWVVKQAELAEQPAESA